MPQQGGLRLLPWRLLQLLLPICRWRLLRRLPAIVERRGGAAGVARLRLAAAGCCKGLPLRGCLPRAPAELINGRVAHKGSPVLGHRLCQDRGRHIAAKRLLLMSGSGCGRGRWGGTQPVQ